MSITKLPIFTDHSRHWRENLYVYPVISRRSGGLSIGVNLNPDMVCNFDCIYCCVDRRQPPRVREVDLDLLREELDRTLDVAGSRLFADKPFCDTPPPLRRLNDVAFSGDGEPTSYPRFEEACRIVADALSRRGLHQVKIVVITNATLFHQPRVRSALAFLDAHNGEVWAKLDAGTEDYYRMVERTSIPLRRVLDNILDAGRARPVVIQSLFMKIRGEPPPQAEVEAYLSRLSELKSAGCQIRLVQVYTTARWTTEDYVSPLEDGPLDAITERVRRLGLPAESFYGPA